MTKRLLIALFVATLVATLPSNWTASAEAQERTAPAPTPPTPPPAPPEAPAKPVPPPPPPAPPARQLEGQPNANVQLDVVVTDTVSGKPEGKRVTLLLRNGHSGSVRTKGQLLIAGRGAWPLELGLDGRVRIYGPGLVEAMVTFTYAAPPSNPGEETPGPLNSPAEVTESLTVMLRTGQPMLVSRSADPVTNRTVTVELTATIREP
jgi:hypothetical protein